MRPANFSIGELARRTGCNIETIRYYERVGLLPLAARRGRYRQYSRDDVSRLGFARRARELGFTLDQIRALFRLAASGQDSCSDARDIAKSHLSDIRARIGDLQRMEEVLVDAVRDCDAGKSDGCALVDALTPAER